MKRGLAALEKKVARASKKVQSKRSPAPGLPGAPDAPGAISDLPITAHCNAIWRPSALQNAAS